MLILGLAKLILVIVGLFLLLFFMWRVCSRYYSLPCPPILGRLVELDNPLSKINRAATIIKYAELKLGMTVLDAGCGPGRLTIPAVQAVGPNGHVVAMDIQKKMLDKVAQKAQVKSLNTITYLHAGIGEGKLAHNAFDRALLITVLGEIPGQKMALQELYTALKPGGLLCITEIIFDPHYQRYATVLQRAQEVGFVKKHLYSDWCAYSLILEKPLEKPI